MTKEEAIKELLFAKRHVSEDSDVDNALDMAINALGAIQLKDLGYSLGEKPRTDGDTVYRQALLDAFGLSEKTRKYGGDHSGYNTMMLYEIQDVIEGMPPAEPEPSQVARDIATIIENEKDMRVISERKTGRWILADNQDDEDVANGNYRYICSECGKSDIHAKTQEVPFCWHCGTRMEVEHEND